MLVTLVAVGYPASPRFVAPPLAGICVLAGVGVVGLWRAAPAVRLGRPLAAVGLAVLLGTLVLPRVGSTAAVAESARVRADVQEDLRSAVRRVGRERLLRCGTPVLRHNMEWNEGALAWELGLPLARVQVLTASEAMERAGRRAVVVLAASSAPTRAGSLARTRVWSMTRFSPGEAEGSRKRGRANLQLAAFEP